MTVARTSQVVAEVIRSNNGCVARASQVVAEVLRIKNSTVIRASQVVVEVLRPNVASASTRGPVVCICT